MELVDRYVQAVRSYLPRKQQDDIARELRENLLSKMEDKAAELGRPLSKQEQEALIREHGHPMVVASRYSREPHPYVIGPVIYPAYRVAVRVALPLVVAASLVVCIARIISGAAVLPALASFWTGACFSALMALGVITAIFAVLERRSCSFGKWDPEKMPRVRKEAPQVSRLASIAELVILSFAAAWWIASPHYIGAIIESGDVRFLKLGPALESLYLPCLLVILATMVQPFVNLLQPHWTRLRLVARTMTACASAIVLWVSLKLGDWIVLADPSDVSASHHRTAEMLNHGTKVGVTIAIVVIVVEVAFRLWRLGREWRGPAQPGISMTLPAAQ